MINKFKSIKKETLQMVAVGIIAVILMGVFLYYNIFSEKSTGVDNQTEGVVLTDGGEASYMNLSIPSANAKKDTLSVLDNLERIKQDSINNNSIKNIGINDNSAAISKDESKVNEINTYKISQSQSNRNPNLNSSKSTNNNIYNSKRHNVRQNSNNGYNNTSTYVSESSSESRNIEEVKSTGNTTGFFSKSKNTSTSTSLGSSKESLIYFASIHSDQIVKDGSRVKMRLTKSATINGNQFPINTIIYGIAKISQNRLNVDITTINQTLVRLQIYDAEDSNKGIYVETPNLNAIIRKELKKDVVDDQDLTSIPFSKTVKNLFERKAKEEVIELLNNYKIIIKAKTKDEN